MAVGFRAKTESGIIQIDGTYQNLSLLAHSYITTEAWATSPWLGTYMFSINAANGTWPILAVRTAGKVTVVPASQTGNTYTWRIVTEGTGVQVEYWVFAKPALIAASAYGMVIRNETTGEVVFDALHSWMRAAGAIDKAMGSPQNYSFPAGGVYAAVISQHSYYNYRQWLNMPELPAQVDIDLQLGMLSFSGTTIGYSEPRWQGIESQPGSPGEVNVLRANQRFQALVLDVTGY